MSVLCAGPPLAGWSLQSTSMTMIFSFSNTSSMPLQGQRLRLELPRVQPGQQLSEPVCVSKGKAAQVEEAWC